MIEPPPPSTGYAANGSAAPERVNGTGAAGQGQAGAGGPNGVHGQPAEHQDQAHGLRVLAARRRAFDPGFRLGQSTRVVAVASGKGGVGKTSVVVNLAVLLARWGKRVTILDCDLGTANVDVMLGLHPRYSLQHVLSRQRRLEEVTVTGPAGVRIIPGGSGLQELANLTADRREELLATFQALDGQADVLLLDTGAGISANVLRFVLAAGEAIVVTTPEPTAITDAYALIKVASQQALEAGGTGGGLSLRLVVNQVISEAEARETAANIATVARRFLNVAVEPYGYIPVDPGVGRAVRAQVPVVEAFPKGPAALAFERLARRFWVEAAAAVAGAASSPDERGAAAPAVEIAAKSGGTAVPGQRPAAQGIGAFVQRMLGLGRQRGPLA